MGRLSAGQSCPLVPRRKIGHAEVWTELCGLPKLANDLADVGLRLTNPICCVFSH
jgi:hypothetical protein